MEKGKYKSVIMWCKYCEDQSMHNVKEIEDDLKDYRIGYKLVKLECKCCKKTRVVRLAKEKLNRRDKNV